MLVGCNMKKILQRFVMFMVLLAPGCMASDTPLGCWEGTTTEPMLDQPFLIKEGDLVTFPAEQLALTFLSKVSESRCTSVCVWEGEASVRLELDASPLEAEQLVLSTVDQGDWQSSAAYGEFKVRLESVTPYPEEGRNIQVGASCAVLTVTQP